MLRICYSFAQSNSIIFNNKKTVCIKFDKEIVENEKAVLNTHVLKWVDKVKHLGNYCCSFYGSHLWKFNSSGFDKCCKSWNIAVRILLGLPFNAHVYLLGPLVGQLGMREQLYVRNFRFLWNAFRLQNHIVSTCMDMALDNSNTCIGYKLAFYRYMYSIDIYRTINFSKKQLCGSNINDEQIAIVNNLSTLLSVRSGNNYINYFTLIEVNDLIYYLSTM